MVGQQTTQALRLLMVALALSATLPRTAADAVTSLGSTTMAATLALVFGSCRDAASHQAGGRQLWHLRRDGDRAARRHSGLHHVRLRVHVESGVAPARPVWPSFGHKCLTAC